LHYLHNIRAVSIVLPDIIPSSGVSKSEKAIWIWQMFQKVADAMEAQASQQGTTALKDAVAIVELFDPDLHSTFR